MLHLPGDQPPAVLHPAVQEHVHRVSRPREVMPRPGRRGGPDWEHCPSPPLPARVTQRLSDGPRPAAPFRSLPKSEYVALHQWLVSYKDSFAGWLGHRRRYVMERLWPVRPEAEPHFSAGWQPYNPRRPILTSCSQTRSVEHCPTEADAPTRARHTSLALLVCYRNIRFSCVCIFPRTGRAGRHSDCFYYLVSTRRKPAGTFDMLSECRGMKHGTSGEILTARGEETFVQRQPDAAPPFPPPPLSGSRAFLGATRIYTASPPATPHRRAARRTTSLATRRSTRVRALPRSRRSPHPPHSGARPAQPQRAHPCCGMRALQGGPATSQGRRRSWWSWGTSRGRSHPTLPTCPTFRTSTPASRSSPSSARSPTPAMRCASPHPPPVAPCFPWVSTARRHHR